MRYKLTKYHKVNMQIHIFNYQTSKNKQAYDQLAQGTSEKAIKKKKLT